MAEHVPPPASPAAIDRGCQCPREQPFASLNPPRYWYDSGCPLHAGAPPQEPGNG